MSMYKKKVNDNHEWVLGMLHMVTISLVKKTTKEKIVHKLLVVAPDVPGIEQKLRWMFDRTEYSEFVVKSVEKVKDKVHFISTSITQPQPVVAVVASEEGSRPIPSQPTSIEKYDPNLYAIGITTTMMAKDEQHALRKLGASILASCSEGKSHHASSLSDDSVIQIEQISKKSGYAMPRDVSIESNSASFVRG